MVADCVRFDEPPPVSAFLPFDEALVRLDDKAGSLKKKVASFKIRNRWSANLQVFQ